MKISFYISAIIVSLFALSLQAQSSKYSYITNDLTFVRYGTKDGLCASFCNKIIQDKTGYIWVSTENGINKFNGKFWSKFQQQSTDTSNRIIGNWSLDLYEDNNKNIWINTDRGITEYNYKSQTTIMYTNPVKGWGKCIALDSTKIFVSAWDGIDILEKQGKQLHLKKHYKESENNSITHLTYINGYVWACPEDHPSLIQINYNTLQLQYIHKISYHSSLQAIQIKSVTAYKKDTILLNTTNLGVLKYCISSNTAIDFVSFKSLNAHGINTSILYNITDEQWLMIGSEAGGLFAYNMITKQIFNYQYSLLNINSITSNNIIQICTDNNYGLWIATDKGLNYFSPQYQITKNNYLYSNKEIGEGNYINAIFNINKNERLIGTADKGLYLIDETQKTTTHISFANKKVNQITQIYLTHKNEILIATNAGIYQYLPEIRSCKSINISALQLNIGIVSVKELNDSLLSFCTQDGLVITNLNRTKIYFDERNKLYHFSDKMICIDVWMHGNKIWIVRFFNGIDILDFNTKNLYKIKSNALNDKPIDFGNIVFDSLQSVYIASTYGIAKINIHTDSVELLATKDGLDGDKISSILYLKNKLYYTNTDGLFEYNLTSKHSSLVLKFDYFPHKWYNQLSITNNNEILGTVSNYYFTHTLQVPNLKEPSINTFIEKLSVNGVNRAFNNNAISLKYNENNIKLAVASLFYTYCEATTWKYSLDNFSTIHTCNNGIIELNNLAPATYTIAIQAIDYRKINLGKPIFFKIIIAKPFYLEYWFLALIALLIGVFVYTFLHFRTKQNQKVIEIRNQISRDLHDELGANVSSINIMAKMLATQNANQENSLVNNISKYSKNINETINDIIWNINPKFDSLQDLITRVIRYASESLDAAEINYNFILPETDTSFALNNHLKYHLYLICKELINNTAKYSKAKMVIMSFRITDNYLIIECNDDGIGFNMHEVKKGNGLLNIEARAQLINAQLSFESIINKGTKVNLKIKL